MGTNVVDDHRSSYAGAKSKEKKPATDVVSQGLHCGIIDAARRLAKRFRIIEADPSVAQVVRLLSG
jgi:hypothetical protein